MKLLAVDTETTGLNPYDPTVHGEIASICGNWKFRNGAVLKLDEGDRRYKVFSDLLADKNITKIFFNAKFDIGILRKAGFTIKGRVYDTSIMARICLPEEDKYTLKYLARKYLNTTYKEEIELKSWLRKQKRKPENGYAGIPKHILYPYAVKDAVVTLQLFHYLTPYMDKYKLWPVLSREIKLMPVIMRMEKRGIAIDTEEAKRLLEIGQIEIEQKKEELIEIAGRQFNPNSPDQVASVVYKDEDCIRYTRTGKKETSALALMELGTEPALKIIQFRKIGKALNTYVKNILKATEREPVWRVSFNAAGARTGRFSSSGYGTRGQLQNIPRGSSSGVLGGIRRMFTARPGHRLALIDYEQIEMRLCAHFTGDETMISAIQEGKDLHSETCKRVFEIDESDPDWKVRRYLAKTLNFAVIYGTGPSTFADTILKQSDGKIRITPSEAKDYIEKYKQAHMPLMLLFSRIEEEVALNGGITNYYGRFVPVDMNKPYVGVNYLIQGTAADLIKNRMIKCDSMLRNTKSHMIVQVHDELIFEIHKDDGMNLIHKLADTMEELHEFKVPLTVSASVGKNWLDKKEIKWPSVSS